MSKSGVVPAPPVPLAGAVLLTGMFGVILGSTIPSGLYAVYQERLALGDSATTVLFSCYVVGVVAALVFGGHLADHLGHRRIIFAALGLSIASAALLALGGSAVVLYLGRIASGASVGICTGAYTAALRATLGPRPGAIASTAVTSGALAAGPLFATAIRALGGDPLRLPFLCHGGVGLLVLAATVALVPETGRRLPGPPPLPRVGVPRDAVAGFLPLAAAIACAYGTNGLFQSVVPLAMPALGGASQAAMAWATAVMLGVSAVTQIAAVRLRGTVVLPAGLALLAVGLLGTASALLAGRNGLFWGATAVTGVGQGLSFRSSLYRTAQLVPADQSSRTVSAYYVVGYVATAVPALAAGFAGGGTAQVAFACGVLAVIAIVDAMKVKS